MSLASSLESLRKIDVNDLDLNNIGSWPAAVKVIVCVLLHGLLDITMLWPQTSLLIMYVVGFSTEYDKEHIFSTSRRHEILPVHMSGQKNLPAGENENSIL